MRVWTNTAAALKHARGIQPCVQTLNAGRMEFGARTVAAAARAAMRWLAAPWAIRGLAVCAGLLGLALLGGSRLARGSTRDPQASELAISAPSLEDPVPPRANPLPSSIVATDTVPSGAASASAASARALAEPAITAGSAAHRATPDDPVVLNTATVQELRRIPGVGQKRAEAMFALREKLGRFRQLEDLLRVRGIGRARLRKLRPLVRLDASASSPASSSPPDSASGASPATAALSAAESATRKPAR
jgi:competence protein ComEA